MDTSMVRWLLADFGALAFLLLILANGTPVSLRGELPRLICLILLSSYFLMRLVLWEV